MITFYNWLLAFLKPLIILIGKVGRPQRKITGGHYYSWRDEISVGTVLLTKTDGELSNLINPTEIKHAALYVGKIKGDDVCYVIEAVGKGVVLTDLVSFLCSKDVVVGCKPKFIRNVSTFNKTLQNESLRFLGLPYDYLFNLDGEAFYCFELAAISLKAVYSELQLKCKEIVKSKRIYDENTFLDTDFFEIVFDSRK